MDILSTLFRLQSRSIGVMVPDVIVSEKHSDSLEITEHPVEIGAAVNDHAYKRASDVTMECGFAGGGSLLDVFDTSAYGISTPFNTMSPKEVYKALLETQERRELIDVVTGKRTYSNMLIRALEVTTDRTSENVLMCTITLREVILSATTPVTVADKKNMQMGVNTSAVKNTGVKATKPVNQSFLTQIKKSATGLFGG
ncbi:hypothetical protein RVO90_22910 [Enterobacter chengduensis]|uniref:phage baseplate protein n=1 Tax=Enterobacter chengduensis TaxID=2494701 RepID=UPI00064AD152|nr:hypothetical protein [Enterobacter chengduensis]EFC2021211.1 hypothetical protein [Escherichia coli]KVK39171.1 hypothetical protein ABF69_0209355 [Enterobacter chengduensis]MDV0368793.1 hypothetical protein [Enterobacter chengduensis]PNL54049.1 hypothetical protein CEP65_015025 [Enterobacter hormaechei]